MTKKVKQRLSLKQKEEVLNLFTEKGLNYKEVAQVTGYNYNQVQYYLSKVKKRRGGFTREVAAIHKAVEKESTPKKPHGGRREATPVEKKAELIALAEANPRMKYTDISKKTGVDYSVVRRVLKEHEAGLSGLAPYTNKHEKYTALKEAQAAREHAFNDIDRKIMEAEMRLEILKEMKAGK